VLNNKAWAKVLRQLNDERTLTFLDRLGTFSRNP
jgi:hypothetical protein